MALNITVWYGSDHSVVKNVRYEDIFIDIDKDYCFNKYDTTGNDSFSQKWGFEPKIVSVSVEKLGKMIDLGSQKCEDIDDYSWFNVYFGDILYKNVRFIGNKRDLPVIVKKHSEIHTVENVKAEDCDFEIEGWS